jgi:hypothetical protein
MPKWVWIIVAFTVMMVTTNSAMAAKPPKPLPPDQANALASAPGDPAVVSVHPVTKKEALSQSQGPGWVTDVPVETAATTTATAAATEYCASGTVYKNWGLWPYGRSVTDHTYWCYVYNNRITYRSTYVTTGGGPLCGGHDQYNFRISGGTGYRYVFIEAGAYFGCTSTIGTLNYHQWLHDEYDVFGQIIPVAWN